MNLTGQTYRQDIEGLRAYAVLSVLIFHLSPSWLPGGFTGVDIFFVISGFVVASSVAHRGHEGFVDFIVNFYSRRFARIIPALLLMLVTTFVFTVLLIPDAWISQLIPNTGFSAFFGFSNWILAGNNDEYFAPRAELNPFTHTWSLGVEEQYYLVAPLFLSVWAIYLCNGRKARAGAVVALLFLLILFSLVHLIVVSGSNPAQAYYSMFTRFWQLASGALLFMISFQQRWCALFRERPTIGNYASLIGCFLMVASFWISDPKGFPYPWAFLPVVATLLVLTGSGLTYQGQSRFWLDNSLMIWIGRRSYSIYLWHWPVIVLVKWTAGIQESVAKISAVLITFLLADLSFRYVEVPIKGWVARSKKSALLKIAGFALLILTTFLLALSLYGNRSSLSLSKVTQNELDWYPGSTLENLGLPTTGTCIVTEGSRQSKSVISRSLIPQGCITENTDRTIFLVGDSHAGMLFPAFATLAMDLGSRVEVVSAAGCPLLNFIKPAKDHHVPSCRDAPKEVADFLSVHAKAGDVVFLSSLRLIRYGDHSHYFGIPDYDNYLLTASSVKQRKDAEEEALEFFSSLKDKKLSFVLSAPLPIFPSPAFRCSDWFNSGNPICDPGLTQKRSYLENLRQPVLDSMSSALFEDAKVLLSIWDALPELCPQDTCSAFLSGRPIYFDGDHISAFGNVVIYDSLKSHILQVLGNNKLN